MRPCSCPAPVCALTPAARRPTDNPAGYFDLNNRVSDVAAAGSRLAVQVAQGGLNEEQRPDLRGRGVDRSPGIAEHKPGAWQPITVIGSLGHPRPIAAEDLGECRAVARRSSRSSLLNQCRYSAVMTTSILASCGPGLRNPCATPRGAKASEPAPHSSTRSPMLNSISPSRTFHASSYWRGGPSAPAGGALSTMAKLRLSAWSTKPPSRNSPRWSNMLTSPRSLSLFGTERKGRPRTNAVRDFHVGFGAGRAEFPACCPAGALCCSSRPQAGERPRSTTATRAPTAALTTRRVDAQRADTRTRRVRRSAGHRAQLQL